MPTRRPKVTVLPQAMPVARFGYSFAKKHPLSFPIT